MTPRGAAGLIIGYWLSSVIVYATIIAVRMIAGGQRLPESLSVHAIIIMMPVVGTIVTLLMLFLSSRSRARRQ